MSWKYHCTKADIHLKLWPKKKAKGWGDLHAGYQHGRVSCLFPTASKPLVYQIIWPFSFSSHLAPSFLAVLSLTVWTSTLFLHLLSSGSDLQADQLSTKRHSVSTWFHTVVGTCFIWTLASFSLIFSPVLVPILRGIFFHLSVCLGVFCS